MRGPTKGATLALDIRDKRLSIAVGGLVAGLLRAGISGLGAAAGCCRARAAGVARGCVALGVGGVALGVGGVLVAAATGGGATMGRLIAGCGAAVGRLIAGGGAAVGRLIAGGGTDGAAVAVGPDARRATVLGELLLPPPELTLLLVGGTIIGGTGAPALYAVVLGVVIVGTLVLRLLGGTPVLLVGALFKLVLRLGGKKFCCGGAVRCG
jgi:hypothetical protein